MTSAKVKLTKIQADLVACLELGLTQTEASKEVGIPKYKVSQELLFAATCNDLDYSTRALLAACRSRGFEVVEDDWHTK